MSIVSPSFRVTMAFFQSGFWPATQPRRRDLPEMRIVLTALDLDLEELLDGSTDLDLVRVERDAEVVGVPVRASPFVAFSVTCGRLE